jgi:hypothetical protein
MSGGRIHLLLLLLLLLACNAVRTSAGRSSFRAQLFARYDDAVYSTIMSQLVLRVSSLCALLLGAAAALEGRSAVWYGTANMPRSTLLPLES